MSAPALLLLTEGALNEAFCAFVVLCVLGLLIGWCLEMASEIHQHREAFIEWGSGTSIKRSHREPEAIETASMDLPIREDRSPALGSNQCRSGALWQGFICEHKNPAVPFATGRQVLPAAIASDLLFLHESGSIGGRQGYQMTDLTGDIA